ncbi:ABC transporter permease [Blastococcus saxobsidens]|uniref:NitT/TauT family transport system permease protein n=1 Tax=Blastococcus saxobsidens TaxID=138336 RepID=A0A4Q7Y480_9ACTN|nr:ABC transporter permease subunit [Blastococcus saxobsidens]RZU30833.1 NitT/TauT family transport system permease protein [Blastococcus saxobsidens]
MWIVRIAVIVVFLVLVEIAVRTELINPFFVPRPSEAVARMGTRLTDGEFLGLVAVTLGETFAGFALAAVVGMVVGFLLWRSRSLGDAFEPLVAALFSSPIVLLYPIFLVILGRNSTAIVALAAVFAVLPTILFTKQALSAVSRTMLNVGRSLNLSAWSNFRHILLPAAAPTIFTGLRIALTYVLIVVVAMEYILQIGGLGRFVSESSLLFRATDLYASVGLIVIISAAFIWAINRLEKLVQR